MIDYSIQQNDGLSIHEIARAKQTMMCTSASDLGWVVRNSIPAPNKAPEPMEEETYESSKTPTFNMVSDVITQAFGPIASIVLARILRYSRMSSGWCYARHQHIADDLGICRNTVEVAISKLIQHGLLEADPNWKSGTTRYYRGTAKLDSIIGQLNELVKTRRKELGDSEQPRWVSRHELLDMWNDKHNSDF